MFVFFLNILRQKSGRYVCVQLLQTLNILFENISHETSLCKDTVCHLLLLPGVRRFHMVCFLNILVCPGYSSGLSDLGSRNVFARCSGEWVFNLKLTSGLVSGEGFLLSL